VDWMSGQSEHWWPVTYDFGLVRSEVERVAATRREQYSAAGMEVDTVWLDAPLQECFARLEPLSRIPTRELYLSTTFGWTAMFQNKTHGSDPSPAMSQLSRTLGVTALRACVKPDHALYAGVILEVYDTPLAGGNEYGYRRSIAAVNDGGRWVFEESGLPYDFEKTARYAARRKRDRFTAEALFGILGNLGILKLTDETLQPGGRSRGFLISRPPHAHVPSYSLAEAKTLAH
jgi:hypothetical protein